MCKNLVEKGQLDKPLFISNRTIKRAADLASELPSGKFTLVPVIDEAILNADIIFTCLSDDAAIKDMTDTICNALNVKGKLFVDCSTVHPDTTDALAKITEAKGAEFVACPVFGAPAMAATGQLICVAAGRAASVKRILPYTTGVIGRACIDLSDQPCSKATHLKIIGNTLILNMIESLAEGHTIAEKSGLGNEILHKFVEAMFPGPYTAYSSRMMTGDYHKREEPLFGVDLARKDAGHALDLARRSGARMRDVEVADEHLHDVQNHTGSKGDIAGIYGAVRQESGLQFEN
ncbi:MAG: hypothetical protein Q9190_003421 [Brigantiaea leucoxantha]